MVIRVTEAIEITFDPKKITFGELLEIFCHT
jgi:peptide methionine sulfoxide reductase MsrA